VSSRLRVAFFELQEQFPDEPLQFGILFLKAELFLDVVMDLKSLICLGQGLVPPLIIEGLADLMRVAELVPSPALQALQHDLGSNLVIPVASWQG
jgi:hypothetical protein